MTPMRYMLKTRKIGNSLGFIIPKEELDRLGVREGDVVYASSEADGLRLTPFDPDFDRAMEAFEDTYGHYRNALKKLAE